MNRKDFLATGGLLLSGGFLPLPAAASVLKKKMQVPPYLKPGDTIGITSPSGYILPEGIRSAQEQIESWGYKVEIGKNIGTRDGSFGGSDEARIAEFEYMLQAPHIKAILCARGGYGVVRIIDRIDFGSLSSQPKWIIGFSDITVFHCHLHSRVHMASIHSKMCNSFPDNWAAATPERQATIFSIRDALEGKIKMQYPIPYQPADRVGNARGLLIGGNLRTIENLAGTASDINTNGKILFLEEVDEQLYNIDRMFWSLKRTGKLKKLAGLIIGGFKLKPEEDPDEKFGLSLVDIVQEKIKGYSFPVCFGFPVGHQVDNYALKCGLPHQLMVNPEGNTLKEL